MEAILQQLGRKQQSYRSPIQRSGPRNVTAHENLPFDGSQIYRDPDTYDDDEAEEYGQQPSSEPWPDQEYQDPHVAGRLSQPAPGHSTFVEPPRYAQFQPNSLSPVAPHNPHSVQEHRGRLPQQPERRPLHELQLHHTPTRHTPTLHRVTESSSPFFLNTSPTPARTPRQGYEQFVSPRSRPQLAIQSEPLFEEGEIGLPQNPTPSRFVQPDFPYRGGENRSSHDYAVPRLVYRESSLENGENESPQLYPQSRFLQPEASFENGDTESPQIPGPPQLPSQAVAGNVTATTQTSYSAPVTIQGIQLVPVCGLPDRFRDVFPYHVFNAVQSKCFPHVMESDDNFVMSAPTGSGKTVVLELAIARLILTVGNDPWKAVYMAPTKALCSERHRDWTHKFHPFDIKCVELTGDTSTGDAIASIQDAQIIITTPEKWDSTTRKWKDHADWMNLVKLLLIDEVHMLKDTRGATLEAVVSRMKVIGVGLRLIALSATVPNADDVAMWLGRSPTEPDEPAHMETFGEEFRPVKLERYVYGYNINNSWNLDEKTTNDLPSIIAKHARGLPILVFCPTRNSCAKTARLLRDRRASDSSASNWWKVPLRPLAAGGNNELNELLTFGVAYHNAGMSPNERELVETGFQTGDVSVICCTSTLAVGVNTPCHTAIIKGTMGYGDEGLSDYSDLDIMQMIGRAGRPQFSSQGAVAVIMTNKANEDKFKRLTSGQEPLESCLHLNLIEHINAEISLGSIRGMRTAHKWLKDTFLYIRLGKNGKHYKIPGDEHHETDRDQRVGNICRRDIDLLTEHNLVTAHPDLESTAFGDAMARYCVRFQTMLVLLSVPERAMTSQILSKLAEAPEFKDTKLIHEDRKWFNELKADGSVRFPLQEVKNGSDKCFLLVQAELGKSEHITKISKKARYKYSVDKNMILKEMQRLVRCVIDCKASLFDAEAVRHGLDLARSLSAGVWEDWPEQLRQIEGIGQIFCRKLIAAGIKSIAELAEADILRINTKTNTSKGEKWIGQAKQFPLPTITVTMNGTSTPRGALPVVNFRVQIGAMYGKLPSHYKSTPVFVILLVERSDGHLVDLRRIKATSAPEPILMCAEICAPDQTIICRVMCDDFAGKSQFAELSPKFPKEAFGDLGDMSLKRKAVVSMNSSRKLSRKSSEQTRAVFQTKKVEEDDIDMFGLSEIEDSDLIAAESFSNFRRLEEIEAEEPPKAGHVEKAKQQEKLSEAPEVRHRSDGRFDCNHPCKDKTACKHLCCRDGLDKPRRPSKPKTAGIKSDGTKQAKLQLTTTQKPAASKPKVDKPVDKSGIPFAPIAPLLPAPEKTGEEDLLDGLGPDDMIELFGEANENRFDGQKMNEHGAETEAESNSSSVAQGTFFPTDPSPPAADKYETMTAEESSTSINELDWINDDEQPGRDEPELAPVPATQPFQDMTGIDPDVLAAFGDFVDFKDD